MLSKHSIKSAEKIKQRAEKMNKSASVIKYTEVVIVSVALAELIGIFGFIFCLISGDFQTLYYLVGISALAMVYYCPKKKELIAVSNELAEST